MSFKKFEYNGKEYEEIDFDNQFTAQQDDYFTPVKAKVNKALAFAQSHVDGFADTNKVLTLLEQGFSELKGRTVAELLAHTYLDKDDKVFNVDTYNERVEMFLNMPVKKRTELEDAIPKFLIDAMKSGAEGILNYLPIPKTKTQTQQ